MKYDVFISYHGGKGNEELSSYKKALELYEYLSNRNLTCFLYKKESNEDFYDAINNAILYSKHFILVACDRTMLSEWVKDEVKQFDGLRKNGKKTNCLISAYIFGSITEQDLYEFNTLFTTKDIACGEDGFEKLYNSIKAKEMPFLINQGMEKETHKHNKLIEYDDFDDVSRFFLEREFKKYDSLTEEEVLRHCDIVTRRLKCMTNVAISDHCNNIIKETIKRIINTQNDNNINPYALKISGQAGTQKSYVLQMLYVCLRIDMSEHSFEPLYINCDKIRDLILEENQINVVNDIFTGLHFDEGRTPLFIIDGILNVVTDECRLDFSLKREMEAYEDAVYVIGVNNVFSDNKIRLNKSNFVRSKYELNLNLYPISLYDKDKCIEYISTLEDLPFDSGKDVYHMLNKSGVLSIDERIVRILCEEGDLSFSGDIVDIFEREILNYLGGDEELLKKGAGIVFDFAYGSKELDFHDKSTILILRLICLEQTFLNYFIAIKHLNDLENYEYTQDFSFFQMIFPKEITHFITSRINNYSKYEGVILSLAQRYNEMDPMGKSRISFFLGRIKNFNYRIKAEELLHNYYEETKACITQRIIDDKYNGKPYKKEEYKQDLFLLRGISVSLIYCSDNAVLIEYIKSLIENELSNSINRGFHLEYYGDKRYLPNQNMLDYEDNVKLGERTLRILFNKVDGQIKSKKYAPSILLEVFTITSLLQARIEIDRRIISFNIKPYIEKCCDIIPEFLSCVTIEDNIIKSFFHMVLNDFKKYIGQDDFVFSPMRYLSNYYLPAKDVKRTGWVMQGIDDPESIVEHMYACWFIGLIFLPNECNEIKGYNKQEILDMLIVHDLAETKLSDIPKYEKVKYPNYDKQENYEMLSILLKGTYSSMGTMSHFVEAWNDWYLMENENACIAKDIDTIQAIYQFLIYNNATPEKFSEERRINWLKEMACVKSSIGQMILQELVLKNELFKSVFDKYSNIIEL